MLFEDYKKLLESFKGVLKNYPENEEALKVHFALITMKIGDFELLKKCFSKHLMVSDFFPSHIEIFSYLNSILSSSEKIESKENAYEMGKRVNWLIWEIEERVRQITDFQKRNKPRAVKILNRELKALQLELDWRQGRIEKPVSKYDLMSKELKELHDKLINKQIVLIACKKDEVYCDGIKAEIRQIEIEISKQERIEGKQEEILDVPF